MSQRKIDRVLEMASRAGVLRPRDLAAKGLPPEYLWRLAQRGLLERVGRGLYSPPNAELITERRSMVEATTRIPKGVVCLVSALRFHEIGTQSPMRVWMAIDRKARKPKTGDLPIRVVRFSGAALTEGVELYEAEGTPLRVYSVPKTVADCFKYRHKIGLGVALEALEESWKARRCTMDEFWHFAKICRVANVMRPYLESVA